MVQTTQSEDIKDIKVLLEIVIHELYIAQERLTEIHQIIHQEVHPRIIQALSSSNEIMAMQAIEMDEETHYTFLQAYKGAAALQKGVETKSEGLFEDTS